MQRVAVTNHTLLSTTVPSSITASWEAPSTQVDEEHHMDVGLGRGLERGLERDPRERVGERERPREGP